MVSGEQKNIRVIVRVRPNNRRELEHNQRTIIKVIDNKTLLFDPDEDEDEFFFQGVKQPHRDITKRLNKKLSMEFDRVFDADATNVEIFDEGTKPLVESVMNGYNCSVFVYGATGAGKTFTMLGCEQWPGITFLTMRELFNKITNLRETRKFDIGISYLEIYNEQVRNLLTKSGPLKLREDSNGVVVSGLVLKPIHNADDLLNLLALGNRNRTQHPTDANSESSRSHAVFQVHIRMIEKKTGQKRTVKLSMIDLAGSERAASTKGLGVRFKEGANINKSLLALGNCINKLADGSKHIPYRDSNLTRLLKDSLGGNCQTVMIANVSPSSLTYEDTYNTLKYASRAKKIRTTIRQNIMKTNMPKDYYVKKVAELMDENEGLKESIKQKELLMVAMKQESSVLNIDESELRNWYRKIDSTYSAVINAQEQYFGMESQMKALRFKQKMKGYCSSKKILILDGLKDEDEATVSQLDRMIDNLKQDHSRALSPYNKCLNDLEKLRKEIKETKYSTILEMYMKGKDSDIQASKERIKWTHLSKINKFYSDIIRNNFKDHCNDLVDNEFRGNLKMVQWQQEPKYQNEEGKESEEDLEFARLSFDEDGSANYERAKRKCQDDDNALELVKRSKVKPLEKFDSQLNIIDSTNENDGRLFKHPSSLTVLNSHLNETHIIIDEKELATDSNTTFHIQDTSDKKRLNDKEIFKSILAEHNVNATNRAEICRVLEQRRIKPQSLKVSTAFNKENKRISPNRIRKSPRPTVRNGTSKALTTAASLLSRYRTKSTTPSKLGESDPMSIVRINRTASMRAKIKK